MKNESKINIFLTGGHAGSTAYALIQKIKEEHPDWKLTFIGAKSAIEGTNYRTLENTYFPRLGIKYISITSGRIQRRFTLWTIPSLFKVPMGVLHALTIVVKDRPSIVVSFGGYTAFPVVISAKMLGIPVVIHEQTFSAGRSNIVSSYLADKVALARAESVKYFPKYKCIVTGNPISKEVSECNKKKKGTRRNSILIAGGSRGSMFLNEIIKPLIPKLTNKFIVYHQTGDHSISEFEKYKLELEKKYKGRYIPFANVEMWKWYKYLDDSDIIISRSGANIVAETTYLNMPSIFIPIPYSYGNEQYKNAKYAKNLGLATICHQEKITTMDLYQEIKRVSENWDNIVDNSRRPNIDDGLAAGKLLDIVKNYVKK